MTPSSFIPAPRRMFMRIITLSITIITISPLGGMLNPKESTGKFTADVGWAFASMVSVMVIGLFVGLFVANYFGSSGFGAYSIVLTIWTLGTLTSGVGIPMALVKHVADAGEDRAKRSDVISAAMVIVACVGGLVALSVFALSSWIESIFRIANLGHYLRIISISFPFFALNDVFISVLNGLRKMRAYAAFETFRRGAILAFTLLLAWLGLGLDGAVISLALSPILTTILILGWHKQVFEFTLKGFGQVWRKLAWFAGQLYAAAGVEVINSQGATLLIGYYLADRDVGVYAAMLMIFGLATLAPQAIQKITYPAFAAHFASGNRELIQRMMEKLMRYAFVFISIMCLVLIFFADDIIRLVFPGNEDYLLAVTPLRILALVAVIYGMIVPVGAIFTSAGRADLPLKISFVQLFVNLGLGIALIPITANVFGIDIGGINGAAIALGAYLMVGVIAFFTLTNRIVHLQPRYGFAAAGLAMFYGLVAFSYLANERFGINGNLLGFAVIPVYSILLFATKIITKDDIKKIWQAIMSGFIAARTG